MALVRAKGNAIKRQLPSTEQIVYNQCSRGAKTPPALAECVVGLMNARDRRNNGKVQRNSEEVQRHTDLFSTMTKLFHQVFPQNIENGKGKEDEHNDQEKKLDKTKHENSLSEVNSNTKQDEDDNSSDKNDKLRDLISSETSKTYVDLNSIEEEGSLPSTESLLPSKQHDTNIIHQSDAAAVEHEKTALTAKFPLERPKNLKNDKKSSDSSTRINDLNTKAKSGASTKSRKAKTRSPESKSSQLSSTEAIALKSISTEEKPLKVNSEDSEKVRKQSREDSEEELIQIINDLKVEQQKELVVFPKAANGRRTRREVHRGYKEEDHRGHEEDVHKSYKEDPDRSHTEKELQKPQEGSSVSHRAKTSESHYFHRSTSKAKGNELSDHTTRSRLEAKSYTKAKRKVNFESLRKIRRSTEPDRPKKSSSEHRRTKRSTSETKISSQKLTNFKRSRRALPKSLANLQKLRNYMTLTEKYNKYANEVNNVNSEFFHKSGLKMQFNVKEPEKLGFLDQMVEMVNSAMKNQSKLSILSPRLLPLFGGKRRPHLMSPNLFSFEPNDGILSLPDIFKVSLLFLTVS
ncbi:unnamed protein product [Bursaphelenchus okinawaensis]|uniref:Uncharacterized protein n=1 Tax=Bursaphelenchus okinawaensis TaxID=465554 RepID=A0A811L0X8_9BILA|nr:unnamed protein product [Bursaphelenchus okinawaensis]CAG9114519.1 unnamed protein product [Bursaphelenchus okinawaensis]